MAEEQVIDKQVEETQPDKDEHPGLAHLSEEDRKAILELREEAAQKRIKAKEALEELERLKQEKKEREEAQLLEDGKLKELLETKEQELKELSPLKDKIESYETYFQGQLEVQLKKLPATQIELIESTDMDVAKKLEWVLKLQEEVNGLKPVPDSVRPGGKAADDNIKMEDYLGKENQHKLVNLSKTNRELYDAIIKEKNKLSI